MPPFADSKPIRRSPGKPLRGTSVLLVEDSRYCAEAVRLFCKRSGARLRRADSIAAAHKHLATYRPDVMIVDLGLPDGDGLDLLSELHVQLDTSIGLVAMSGDTDQRRLGAVNDAGVGLFLAKPLTDLLAFQRAVIYALGEEAVAPGFVPQIADRPPPDLDQQALADDIEQMRTLLRQALNEADVDRMRYAAQFASSVATVAQDDHLLTRAEKLRSLRQNAKDLHAQSKPVLDLVDERLRTASGF